VLLAAVSLTQILELLGIGALAGVLGGMLGIGGGIVMIPAMVFILGQAETYGPNYFHAYKLAAITTSIILSLPAAIRHSRAKAVVYAMLPGMVPLALVGVLAGVLTASYLTGASTNTLRRIFGVFLEFVVVVTAFQEWRSLKGEPHLCDACPMPRRRALLGTIVGLPAGIIAGLLGVGGGIWAVPAQSLLFGVRLRNAIANSSVMIIGVAALTSLSLTAFIARLPADPQMSAATGWWLALWLAPGAILGGWCGAGLTHRLPVRWLRYAFLLLLGITGYRLITG